MSKPAISFNVPPKLWAAFKTQVEDLFLKYSPFLDYMVSREVVHLRHDLAGLKLSLRAKRHIAGSMKRMEPTSVNIEVRAETADALRAALAEHNLVRDAFMSRLVIFLRSTDKFLELLEVPKSVNARGTGAGLEDMPVSPLRAMEAVRDDPLYYIRVHVEAVHGCGLYRVRLPPSLDWAACHLPDEDAPGTAAYKRKSKEDAALMAMLEGRDPPPKPVRRSTRSRS